MLPRLLSALLLTVGFACASARNIIYKGAISGGDLVTGESEVLDPPLVLGEETNANGDESRYVKVSGMSMA